MDELTIKLFEELGIKPEELDTALIELIKLRKFRETFKAYDLAKRQGYVAYEILQEYNDAIDKILDRAKTLKDQEDKTEFERGILRGYHVALTVLGFLNDF
jgi:hypothetical protein